MPSRDVRVTGTFDAETGEVTDVEALPLPIHLPRGYPEEVVDALAVRVHLVDCPLRETTSFMVCPFAGRHRAAVESVLDGLDEFQAPGHAGG